MKKKQTVICYLFKKLTFITVQSFSNNFMLTAKPYLTELLR